MYLKLPVTCTLVSIVLLLGGSVSGIAQEQLVTHLDGLEWGPPGGGNGFPVGVQTYRLGIDQDTGGITYFARFPAGSNFALHWHTHDEFVSVVEGEVIITLGDELHPLKPGSYVVIPGSLPHAWDVPDSADVVILVRRAGPADFHFIGAESPQSGAVDE